MSSELGKSHLSGLGKSHLSAEEYYGNFELTNLSNIIFVVKWKFLDKPKK